MAERQCFGCLDTWPCICKQIPSLRCAFVIYYGIFKDLVKHFIALLMVTVCWKFINYFFNILWYFFQGITPIAKIKSQSRSRLEDRRSFYLSDTVQPSKFFWTCNLYIIQIFQTKYHRKARSIFLEKVPFLKSIIYNLSEDSCKISRNIVEFRDHGRPPIFWQNGDRDRRSNDRRSLMPWLFLFLLRKNRFS